MRAKHGFFGVAIGTLINPLAGIAYLAVKATQPDEPKSRKGLPVYEPKLGRYLRDDEITHLRK